MINTSSQSNPGSLVLSYKTLRNFIGFSGILLPFIQLIFTQQRQNDVVIYQGSMSDYYYTNTGEIFVIIICTTAIFLFTYKGYDDFWEKILINLAAIGALGLVLFPTNYKPTMPAIGIHVKDATRIIHIYKDIELHWVFAAMFFICLAILSIFFFTESNKQGLVKKEGAKMTQKSWRNIVYISMGWLMLLCLAFILALSLFPSLEQKLVNHVPIFIAETIATVAFGISWITKGETLFPDNDHYVVTGIKALLKK